MFTLNRHIIDKHEQVGVRLCKTPFTVRSPVQLRELLGTLMIVLVKFSSKYDVLAIAEKVKNDNL